MTAVEAIKTIGIKTYKHCRQIEWNYRKAWNKVDSENAIKGDYSVIVAEKITTRKNKQIEFLCDECGLDLFEALAIFDNFRFKGV